MCSIANCSDVNFCPWLVFHMRSSNISWICCDERRTVGTFKTAIHVITTETWKWAISRAKILYFPFSRMHAQIPLFYTAMPFRQNTTDTHRSKNVRSRANKLKIVEMIKRKVVLLPWSFWWILSLTSCRFSSVAMHNEVRERKQQKN